MNGIEIKIRGKSTFNYFIIIWEKYINKTPKRPLGRKKGWFINANWGNI
jgi:hypothetical protein